MRGLDRNGLLFWTGGLLAVGSPVNAHNGIPDSNDVIFEDLTDPQPLVVASFGVLTPRSRYDWRWVCPDVTQQPSLSAFAALPDGTWFMGTIAGLYVSPDRCQWDLVGDPLAGLYITRLEPDTVRPDRLWVSTSTGGYYNALWYSDDSGQSFQEAAYFGEGSTIRGFLQGPLGVPWYVVGWRDNVPYLWSNPDGKAWEERSLASFENASIYPLAIDTFDDQRVYLAVRTGDSDTLVRISADGSQEPLLEMADQITAFSSGFFPGELWAGGRYEGLYYSDDDGATWSGPTLAPEAGCLVTHGDLRFQCTNNILDGWAVMSQNPGDSAYTPLLWFGDVHAVEECPEDSETTQVCGVLWETQKALVGMDLERDPTSTATPDPVEEGGCGGCSVSGVRSGTGEPPDSGGEPLTRGPRGMAAGVLTAALLFCLRIRTRRHAWGPE